MEKSNVLKYIGVACLGCIVGVFISNYQYFTLNKEISLSDLLIFIGTSVIALYVAKDIQQAIEKNKDIKSFYFDELKEIIKNIELIENWVNAGNVNTHELHRTLKLGNLKLKSMSNIFKDCPFFDSDKINTIKEKYTDFQEKITDEPTNDNKYKISNATIFLNLLEELRGCIIAHLIQK